MTARLLLVLILAGVAPAQANSTYKYTVLFQGRPGGSQTTVVGHDGRITVDLSYRSNGRGPDVREEIVLARDGTQKSHRLAGKSTFGAPIDEFYSRQGTRAEWKSTSDQGQRDLTKPAVYYPVSEAGGEVLAILVRAMIRQNSKTIDALPGGELAIRRLAQTRVQSNGRQQDVVLFAIRGLSFEPTYVWLTREPELRLFAFIYPGFVQMIETGWEAGASELERQQLQADGEQLQSLVPALAHRGGTAQVIRNVRVFDSEHAVLSPPRDVYIYQGRIASVYDTGSAPQDAASEVIDGAGRVLLPALFDMHDHAGAWRSLMQVAGGVTTVRDMANDNAVLADLGRRIDDGRAVGPRIIPAGFIEGESDYSARNGFVAADIDGVKRAIDWYAQRGFPQLKLYNSFRREWVAETTRYAHERGLRVSGHVPAFMRAEEVVEMGYDELQHINQVMLNFLVGPQDDTRTLARFYLVMENAHTLDLDSRKVRQFLALLRKKGTVVDPTAATFEDFYQMPGQAHPAFAAVVDHLPATVQRSLHTTSFDVTAQNAPRYRASYGKMLEMIGRMHKAGVPLVAGTDHHAGFTLHRELELYAQAGIPPAEVLRIATWNGARYTRTLDRLGSVTPGKLADLILVDGDPTTRISDIRRIRWVMKEGTRYYPDEIYPAIGVRPFGQPEPASAAKP